MSHLRPACNILGMKICNEENRIRLVQSYISYMEKVLKIFQMKDCKLSCISLEKNIKSRIPEDGTSCDYKGLIGCLMYIAIVSRCTCSYSELSKPI